MIPLFFLSILTSISCGPEALVEYGQVYHIWNSFQATEEIRFSDPFLHLSDQMGLHMTSLPEKLIFD